MVSVIIPVYNGAALLEQSLRSVLAQSYKELQVIVIDDGSKDASYEICEKIAQKDSRVCLVRQKNAGVSAARNKGISLAEGEFVIFVDADDILPTDAVRALVEACTPDVDLVVGSHEEFRGRRVDRRIRKPEIIIKDGFKTDALRVEKLVRAAWGKLYRTDILLREQVYFDLKIPFMEDTLFTWKYCKHIRSIKIIDQIVYRYRLGGMASTKKYYPERCRYFVTALTVYSDFYGGVDQIPRDFLQEKVTGGLLDCIIHYLCYCSAKEAEKKIRITLEAYAPFLNEKTIDVSRVPPKLARAILAGEIKEIMSLMYGRIFPRVIAKKVKTRLCSIKNRETPIKVGVVSLFDNNNHGNRLQNYAMQQVLLRYADRVITIKNKPYYSEKSRLARMLPLAESVLLNRLLGMERRSQFVRFTRRYITTSRYCYWYDREGVTLKKADHCDLYCAGSDQIWNPAIGRRCSFDYLSFADSEKTFAYAASFGGDSVQKEFQDVMRKGLRHIKYISVREDTGRGIVENLTGRTDAQVLVDPTMLLTCQEWDRVISKPRETVPENYVLTYFLGAVSDKRKAAIQARAQELGCQLIELMDPDSPFYAVGPDGFVWLIKNARYICTDSFHGSVFSFLYGRPFAVFTREGKGADMGSRMKTFMAKFSLEDCAAVGDTLPEYCAQPDFSSGYAALEEERAKSKTFLEKVFREIKG